MYRVPKEDVSKYGIIQTKSNELSNIQAIETLVEKPTTEEAPFNLAIMGRYVLTLAIFPILANLSTGKGGEIQLTDGLNKLNEQEKVLAYHFKGKRSDIGDKLGFVQATIEFALNRSDLKDEIKQFMEQSLTELND